VREEMDKNDDQWTTLLKGLGLTVDLEVVREVATQVVGRKPLYPLYKSRVGPPLAAKGTVYKIKRLIEAGKLDPLLHYWGLKQPAETDPLQLAHLKALMTFLQQETILIPFTVKAPSSRMELTLKELVGRYSTNYIIYSPWRGGVPWEDLPIATKIRDHCPDHELWQHIDDWKGSEGQYHRAIVHIGRELQGEFHDGLGFPASEITNPALELHLLLDIFNWLIGQLLGNVPHFGSVYSELAQRKKGGELIFRLAWGDAYYAEGTEKQIEQAKAVVQGMIKRWSDSDKVQSLFRQYNSLKILVQRIRDEIQNIDEATLAKGRCPDCPIATSKQG
jgi:hypothetical protein